MHEIEEKCMSSFFYWGGGGECRIAENKISLADSH